MLKLELRMLNYFLLIIFAAVMIGIEFYFELGRGSIRESLCLKGSGCEDTLDQLRNKIIIMLGVQTMVVAIVLMMFMKNITIPLCKMVVVASEIAAGDLSKIVEVETKDEIGQVGNTINELTSNLQELATFTSINCHEALDHIQSINESLVNGNTPAPEDMNVLKGRLVSVTQFVDAFKLL